ncbi:protease 2 [Acrasis kona]|uniref:Prolyl endopeptidase n=1 Tax=Acrasis kona TaxID=1008807 RepID=A0AAW2ZNP0_9EUKA
MDRIMVPSHDNQNVPLTLIYDTSVVRDKSHPQPVIISGYGAYGTSMELNFNYQRLLLLKKGFIVAFAHVRGGSEKGREWYTQGKACTEYLINNKYTNKDLICSRGISAGGLLVAGALSMRSDLFKCSIIKVPFLDVTGVMTDPLLPLTEHEVDEWGDPIQSKQVLDYISKYSPYDTLLNADLSTLKDANIYLVGCEDDYRAPLWNVVKYLARLRNLFRDDNSPIAVLKVHQTGHLDEAYGFYAQRKQTAEEFYFISKSLKLDI